MINSVLDPHTLALNLRKSARSSIAFLWFSSPSLVMEGRNLLQTPFSSSFIKPLRTARHGMVMNISESHVSTISPNCLYFSAEFSIALLSWLSCYSFSSYSMWSLASDQAFSRSPTTSDSSLLLRSIGSTTSMFSAYFLISMRKRWKVCLTCSEIFLIAAVLEALEESFSDKRRTSSLKSSRPLPWTLVTGLISQSLWTSCLRMSSPLRFPFSSY